MPGLSGVETLQRLRARLARSQTSLGRGLLSVLSRDSLDRGAFLRLGKDRVHDDGVPGRQRAVRLVLENGIDALRHPGAVVLAIEALRLGNAKETLTLDIAAHVQSARSRAEARRKLRGKGGFAGA